MLSDTQREFKRAGHCEARIRVQYPAESYMANVNVQEGMHDSRRHLVEALMILGAMDGAECVGLTMEAWMVLAEGMDTPERRRLLEQAKKRQLHQHPNRVEAISVAYSSRDLECSASARIYRGPDRLGKWEFMATPPLKAQVKLGATAKFTCVYAKADDPEYRAWVQGLLGDEMISKFNRRRA
jgi:hypothetical protein